MVTITNQWMCGRTSWKQGFFGHIKKGFYGVMVTKQWVAILPSHATHASRSPRARLAFASVPLKYAKNTPVLQVNVSVCSRMYPYVTRVLLLLCTYID